MQLEIVKSVFQNKIKNDFQISSKMNFKIENRDFDFFVNVDTQLRVHKSRRR